jgi:small subunit ribosomal protein S3
MGQKVHPLGFRIGVMEDWNSRWYASKSEFATLIAEDYKIRKHIKEKHKYAGIPKIEIERTRQEVKVILHTARPGTIIGKRGQEVDKLQEELQELTQRKITIKIEEVKRPELEAQLVAESIAEQLEKRTAFRRAMKRAMDQAMQAGAKGIKVELAGRLQGADMSRREKAKLGRVPLQTLRAKISYGFAEARTQQGVIGVKVWINLGDYLSEEGASDGAHAKTR